MNNTIEMLAKVAADYQIQKAQGTHGNSFRRLPMSGPAKPAAKPAAKPPAPAKKPGMSLEEMGTLRTKMPSMPARQPAKKPAPQMPDMRPVGNVLRSAGSGLQSLMQKIQAYQQQAKPRSTGPLVDDYWSGN